MYQKRGILYWKRWILYWKRWILYWKWWTLYLKWWILYLKWWILQRVELWGGDDAAVRRRVKPWNSVFKTWNSVLQTWNSVSKTWNFEFKTMQFAGETGSDDWNVTKTVALQATNDVLGEPLCSEVLLQVVFANRKKLMDFVLDNDGFYTKNDECCSTTWRAMTALITGSRTRNTICYWLTVKRLLWLMTTMWATQVRLVEESSSPVEESWFPVEEWRSFPNQESLFDYKTQGTRQSMDSQTRARWTGI